MKIAILSANPKLYSTRRLVEAGKKKGHEMIIIDHTEVSDRLRGKGAGLQLVTAAVDYARENKIKILPLCTFAKSVFDRTPTFHDVLNK